MRRACTLEDLRREGWKQAAIARCWRRIERGVYVEGREPVTILDRAVAAVVATGGVANGRVAAALLELDCPGVQGPDVTVPPSANGRRRRARRRLLPAGRVTVVQGLRCTDGLQILVDLSAELSDLAWEQVLESALRKRLTTVVALGAAVIEMSRARTPGTRRVRRVLDLRPVGAPPTESLLETLTVQLIRNLTGLPEPTRQVEVYGAHSNFIARVDLAWPELGIFLELDGQQHAGQPVYDAVRELAVVTATGWLPGRLTWHQVVRVPRSTARDLDALASRAHSRLPRPA